ncbi:uncharacterized protein MCAP_0864-like [Montipora foliosa]|uniref:uncharacterized protein MCAP_0864-like n=1 Tax=Montipora foliosa TaxID=591990 RepID=UPI0035F203B5
MKLINSQRLMSALRDKEAALKVRKERKEIATEERAGLGNYACNTFEGDQSQCDLREFANSVKEAANDMTRIQTEKNANVQRLQLLLNSKEHEVQALENSKAWASQENSKGLVESGKEKDKLLKALQICYNLMSAFVLIQESAKSPSALLRWRNLNGTLAYYKLTCKRKMNKLKFEDLRHEVKAKDAHLKQVQASNENLRSRIQRIPKVEELKQKFAEQSQALADAQKSKEQALVDLVNTFVLLLHFKDEHCCSHPELQLLLVLQVALKKSNLELEAELKVQQNDVEMLNEAAQMKDSIIKEMQEDRQKQLTGMKENIGYYQKKAQELEGSNNLLNQQLMETEDLKNSLEPQLENCKRRLWRGIWDKI